MLTWAVAFAITRLPDTDRYDWSKVFVIPIIGDCFIVYQVAEIFINGVHK